MNGWNGRTTLEMLGQAGLGYSFDNFEEDSSDPYGESLKLFLSVPFSSSSLTFLNDSEQPCFEPRSITWVLGR